MKNMSKMEYQGKDPDVAEIYKMLGPQPITIRSEEQLQISDQATYLDPVRADFNTFFGKTDKYRSAQSLWEACLKYFAWCDRNPIEVPEIIRSGVMAGVEVSKKVTRPFILEELLVHIGVSKTTYKMWKSSDKYKNLQQVCEVVESMIYARKITGAYTGLYNGNLAQKDLQMVEQVKTETHAVVEHVVTGMRIIESSEE